MTDGLVAVQADRQQVEEHPGSQRAAHLGLAARVVCRHTVAQLHRPGHVHVAPQGVLGLVAELFHGVGLQGAGVLVGRVGEDQVVAQLHGPAVVALVDGGAHLLEHRVGAAHGLDVALAGLHRRERVEVGRIAVVEAQVALVDRAQVGRQRAVVAAQVPLLVQFAG
ncbi:hypothetical protein D3C78_758400 [compost metagenome]